MKKLLTQRLSCICLLWALAQTSSAQSPLILSADFSDTDLRKAIRRIERDYDLSFSYEDALLKNVRISARFQKLPLRSALEKLLADTELDFEIIDHQYVILKKYQKPKPVPPVTSPSSSLLPHPSSLICGKVLDAETGESLPGATAYVKRSPYGASSDEQGNFSLTGNFKPADTLEITYLGYEPLALPVGELPGKPCADYPLQLASILMPDVVIRDFTTDLVRLNEEGDFTFKKEKIPTLPGWGEPDVLRSLQLLPGIGSADESASNLNVRGGTPDQNLVLWDGIPIFHTGHFFGLYDAFNPFVVDKMDVWRGNFGSEYGGRNSSVIDIESKSDFLEKSRKGIGLNLLSVQGYLQSPLRKNKMTLLVAFRRSYTDLIQSQTYLNLFNQLFQNGRVALNEREVENGDAYRWEPTFSYGDFNLKLCWKGKRHRVSSVSIYSGGDRLDYRFIYDDSTYYGGTTDLIYATNFGMSWQHAAKWSPVFSVKYKVAVSAYTNDYTFIWNDRRDSAFVYRWDTNNTMSDFSAHFHHDWQFSERHRMSFGYQLTSQEASVVYRDTTLDESANVWENETNRTGLNTFYGEFRYEVSPQFSFGLGIRENHFPLRGLYYSEPRVHFSWKPFGSGQSAAVGSGQSVESEVGGSDELPFTQSPVPKLPNHSSPFTIKGGFGRYWQFVFQIVDFNDLGVGEPQWALSNEFIPAQELWQWTFGASYETKTLLIDADIYLKNNRNLTSLNLRLDRGFGTPPESYDGKSTAAGLDFLLRKRWRNYSLWLSYATGRVEQQFPELNDSLPYPARHDIRQRLNFVNTYSLPHWDFSFNFNLRSGTPYSIPEVVLCEDCEPQAYVLSYPRLNTERLPGAVRLDIGATYKFERRNLKGKIGMSMYNLLNRRNLLDKDFLLENTPNEPENPWKLQELNRQAAGVTPNLFFQVEW